jgi:uncharacterized protein HemX
MSEPPTPSDNELQNLANSLVADRPTRPRAAEKKAPSSGLQRAVLSSALALVLSLIAITVAGMLWWQYRQFYVSLDQTDATAALALERVRAEQRALQDRLEGVNDDVETLRQLNNGMGARVDALPSRFAEIERRLAAVQGGSFDARATLLRAQAEYYLVVANTELALVGSWDNAITALELADGRLAELANPRLGVVREAIASELLSLRSVRLPDMEGLIFSLGRLAARSGSLPMRADRPANFADRAATDRDAEPGFERLWLALKRALLGLVRIERRDEPVAPVLSAAQRELGRRQLELDLELARIAALRAQPQAFQSSIDTAVAILQRDFATDSGEVEGALALLKEIRALPIDPERPDISGSLTLLRGLPTEGP